MSSIKCSMPSRGGLNWLIFNQSKTSFPLLEHNYSLLSNETRNLPPFHLYMKNNPYPSFVLEGRVRIITIVWGKKSIPMFGLGSKPL